MARHAQISKIISLLFLSNMLRKKWVINLFFLYVDKHANLLQIDTKIFYWGWSSIPKVAKIASLQCLYNISKRKLEIKLTSWMQINIKVSYKLVSALWASKFPTRWYYRYWGEWSSLQYLYNISKNKFGIKSIFCMQIKIKTCTS